MNRVSDRRMREDVEALFTSSRPSGAPDLIGVEIELIPITRGPDPRPVRLFESTHGIPSLVDLLRDWARSSGQIREERRGPRDVRFHTDEGGRITFEPGGQLEFSSAPRPSAAAVLADLLRILDPLCEAAEARGIRLLGRGLNPWHDVDDVDLQLDSPRYLAMNTYLRRSGLNGVRMMRLTAAMQINLDFGTPAQALRRWHAANLLSPVIRASFANSWLWLRPGVGAVSGRSVIWERTDASRTGVLVSAEPDTRQSPSREYLDFALAAQVMIRRNEEGATSPAEANLRFDDWWRGGALPPPGASDWETHLTTLFPDVRPRGWLELRAIDAPRRAWWAVPLTVLPAVLLDDGALDRVLEILEPLSPRIADLASRAGVEGLTVESVGNAAEQVFLEAIESAHRAPEGYFSPQMLSTTEEFVRCYITRRRTQADEERAISEFGERPALQGI